MRKSWERYYENTKSLEPSKFLVQAIKSLGMKSGTALDLGCGAGRDSKYLLERGFDVHAVDKDPSARKYLDYLPHQERLTFTCAGFENFTYADYDVINAHYALPFCERSEFENVVARITTSIKPGGVFVGQLFGIDDEWNTDDTKMSFHERIDVERIFDDFDKLLIHEVNEDGPIANGSSKHCHVFNIIAQKST